MPGEDLLLPKEEEDKYTPTREEIEAYLLEPDDALAKALTKQQRCLIATVILYGRNMKRAQLAYCKPLIEAHKDAEWQEKLEEAVKQEKERIIKYLRGIRIGAKVSGEFFRNTAVEKLERNDIP